MWLLRLACTNDFDLLPVESDLVFHVPPPPPPGLAVTKVDEASDGNLGSNNNSSETFSAHVSEQVKTSRTRREPRN